VCLKRVGSPHFSRFVLVPVHFHIMLVPLFTFRRFAGFPFIFGVVGGTFYHGAVFAYISFTGYFDLGHPVSPPLLIGNDFLIWFRISLFKLLNSSIPILCGRGLIRATSP